MQTKGWCAMLDTQLQMRIMKSSTDAAFGYANATAAAYTAMFGQALAFWAEAGRAMSPEPPKPRSWFREPDPHTGIEPFSLADWPFAWARATLPAAPGSHTPPPYAVAASPLTAWFDMFPLKGPPASWPMAYNMMCAGVPRSVAQPMAEANVAAADAVEAAKAQVNKTFSSYRSAGGHATAQIVMGGELMLFAAMAPVAVHFLWPMLPNVVA